MPTVKELKKYIRNNRPPGCRPYSKLKRNELSKLAKELGYIEPEKKAPAKKAPAKKAVVKKAPAKKAPEKKEAVKLETYSREDFAKAMRGEIVKPKPVVKKAPEKKAPEKKAPAKKAVEKPKFKDTDEILMTTDTDDLKQFLGKVKQMTDKFEKEYKQVIDKLLKPIQGKKTDDHREKVKKVMNEYNDNFAKKEHPIVANAKNEFKKNNTLDFPDEQLFAPIFLYITKQFNRIKRAVRR